MPEVTPLGSAIASYCPPVGKPLAYGKVLIFETPTTGRQVLFRSDDLDARGAPIIHTWLSINKPAQAKFGGRIDCQNMFYIIIGGGKAAAKEFVRILNG